MRSRAKPKPVARWDATQHGGAWEVWHLGRPVAHSRYLARVFAEYPDVLVITPPADAAIDETDRILLGQEATP